MANQLWIYQSTPSGDNYCNPVLDGKNGIIIAQDYDSGCKGIEYYSFDKKETKIIHKYKKNIKVDF